MAETQRTISALQTLLADNNNLAISAQDVRDLMETSLVVRNSTWTSTQTISLDTANLFVVDMAAAS